MSWPAGQSTETLGPCEETGNARENKEDSKSNILIKLTNFIFLRVIFIPQGAGYREGWWGEGALVQVEGAGCSRGLD